MEKKSIPGWAYMIIGLMIMGYTKFIQYKQPSSKIGLFFWVGIIFLIIGILREFVPRMTGSRERRELAGPPPYREEQTSHLHPGGHQLHGVSPHMTHQHTMPQQHPSHPYEPLHKQCPRCHLLTHNKNRFCQNCGHQFF